MNGILVGDERSDKVQRTAGELAVVKRRRIRGR